jgi:hypothetical protein
MKLPQQNGYLSMASREIDPLIRYIPLQKPCEVRRRAGESNPGAQARRAGQRDAHRRQRLEVLHVNRRLFSGACFRFVWLYTADDPPPEWRPTLATSAAFGGRGCALRR